jgi:hypothetical protein
VVTRQNKTPIDPGGYGVQEPSPAEGLVPTGLRNRLFAPTEPFRRRRFCTHSVEFMSWRRTPAADRGTCFGRLAGLISWAAPTLSSQSTRT